MPFYIELKAVSEGVRHRAGEGIRVRSVWVMRSCLTASALLISTGLAACAGAPMDMSAGFNGASDATAHAELHQSASRLRFLVEDQGWTLGGTPLMARLIRGHDSTGERAVARYLDAVEGNPAAVLSADAGRLTQASHQTASLAMRAASAPNAGPEALAADLAAVEGRWRRCGARRASSLRPLKTPAPGRASDRGVVRAG